MFTITLEFLEENYACKQGIDWFLKQNKPEMSVQDLKEANCSINYMGWVAECLYRAGLNWPGDRYNEDILKALLATGCAAYISLARDYWPKERFHNPSANKERK